MPTMTTHEPRPLADDDLMKDLRWLQKATFNNVRQDLSKPITEAAALTMRSYLVRRTFRPGFGRTPDSPLTDLENSRQFAMTMMQGQMQDAIDRRSPQHDVRPGRRPGTKVTEPGIYFYNDHIYKIIRSQYTQHLQARRMDPATGRFAYVEGMMGVLRAEDRMTPEHSIRYEELYGDPRCSDCGLPLENDLSRQRRIGPICWVKNGHADEE